MLAPSEECVGKNGDALFRSQERVLFIKRVPLLDPITRSHYRTDSVFPPSLPPSLTPLHPFHSFPATASRITPLIYSRPFFLSLTMRQPHPRCKKTAPKSLTVRKDFLDKRRLSKGIRSGVRSSSQAGVVPLLAANTADCCRLQQMAEGAAIVKNDYIALFTFLS